MLIDNLDLLPQCFKDGIRIVMLLHRNKDGCKGNAHRKAYKKISRNAAEWNDIVQEYRTLQLESLTNYRIYSSVNARCMKKAMHEFSIRKTNIDFGGQDQKDWFYIDIHNNFISCLANPGSRAESYFLFDCDTILEYEICRLHLENTTGHEYMNLIVSTYRTKNGYHILTRPHKPIPEIAHMLKKDDLIYIG